MAKAEPKGLPRERARRWLAARVDASVGSIERHIERTYRLPDGSVRLVLPNRKSARRDKKIGAFLRDWGR